MCRKSNMMLIYCTLPYRDVSFSIHVHIHSFMKQRKEGNQFYVQIGNMWYESTAHYNPKSDNEGSTKHWNEWHSQLLYGARNKWDKVF